MIRSRAHLALVRSLSCCYCGSYENVQAAHIRRFGHGGTGIKPSDDRAIPLCFTCHTRQHNIGELSFHGGVDGVFKAIEYAKSLFGMKRYQALEKTIQFRRTVIA